MENVLSSRQNREFVTPDNVFHNLAPAMANVWSATVAHCDFRWCRPTC